MFIVVTMTGGSINVNLSWALNIGVGVLLNGTVRVSFHCFNL